MRCDATEVNVVVRVVAEVQKVWVDDCRGGGSVETDEGVRLCLQRW